jgi:hypothetical protein
MRSASLVASFACEEDLVAAALAARARGLDLVDAFTAYPVEGLASAIGVTRSRLPLVTFAAAAAGFGAAMMFQFYAAVFDWRLDVGGKPANSTLAFVPIGFEIAVLGAALVTTLVFLLRCRLRPGVQVPSPLTSATDGGFLLAVRVPSSHADHRQAERLLIAAGAHDVRPLEVTQ